MFFDDTPIGGGTPTDDTPKDEGLDEEMDDDGESTDA